MDSHGYDYTLTDLLCLSDVEKLLEPLGNDFIIKAITEWAENEVMAGHDSESLLILASLNLDKTPEVDEVRCYLNRFMREESLSYPGYDLSALTWLKIKLREITHCDDAQTAESCLSYFATRYWDYSPRFFARTCNSLNWLYYGLFDNYGDQLLSPAEQMSEEELLTSIRKYVSQFERKLFNQDWVAFLSEEDKNLSSKQRLHENFLSA